MKIKRTAASYRRESAAWVADPWNTGDAYPFADQVFAGEFHTHSPVLGPDGNHLEYEPLPKIGFDLRARA